MTAPLPTPPGTLSGMKADGSRHAIHPADVRGPLLTKRRVTWAVLLAVYLAAPLVPVGGHPAVHLDVAARRFYLFGGTFNAQDFWLVLFLLTTTGFGLLFATAWRGRVWCGWACPQTVFLESLYRPIERLVDGPRERRLRAEAGPWTVARAGRAVLKHGLYLVVSAAVSHVALALFLSAHDLTGMVRDGPTAHPVAFGWAAVTTGLLYFNFAWFREQLCVVVCPYGRLQSVMHDRDSIIVGYDARRGEPRGRKGTLTPEGKPPGDCVDCNRCVVVCPTGIDIRNGLQLECLACAQCVDACDNVMDKLGRPRGLIRYDSLNGLAGQPTRVLRPRLFIYGALLLASVVGLVLGLSRRTPFEANLLRMPGAPYVLDAAEVRNQYEVHLVSKRPGPATFRLSVDAPPGVKVVLPQAEVELPPLESHRFPLFVVAPQGTRPFDLSLRVSEVGTDEARVLPVRFLSPTP